MKEMRMELEQCLARHCAPVFYGRKSANLISVEKAEEAKLEMFLKETGVSWAVLCSCSQRSQILLYDRKRLEAYLAQEENRAFLVRCGYDAETLEGKLQQLTVCYEAYRKQGAEFPHEIGLFLEYPLADILSYITHKGKYAIHNGYWKVYHNPDQAKERFQLYDKLRDGLLELLEEGHSLAECVQKLQGNRLEPVFG